MDNNKILVFENFLDVKDFENIKRTITDLSFPWHYNSSICQEEDEKDKLDNCQFVHLFYKSNPRFEISPHFPILVPLLERLKVDSLCRIKANLNLRTEKPVKHCFHDDHKIDLFYSSILYINDNDGGTYIKDRFIESKSNRMVLFPSQTLHSGVSQTNTKRRLVINTVFTING
jgi:hypothetical protein